MRFAVGIAGALFLIAFASTYFSSRPETPQEVPGTTEVTVTLSEDGFSPSTLTIEPGTKVTFVSKTKSFFWPASNPHPTHTIYAAFDPQEPIRPDGSWGFVFTQEGTWRYHDHLAPYFTGTITVSSRTAP